MGLAGDAEKTNAWEKYLASTLIRLRCCIARHFWMPTVRFFHIVFFSRHLYQWNSVLSTVLSWNQIKLRVTPCPYPLNTNHQNAHLKGKPCTWKIFQLVWYETKQHICLATICCEHITAVPQTLSTVARKIILIFIPNILYLKSWEKC